MRYHKRDREAKNLENQIQALEKQNAELENKATNAENQRKHLEKENNRLRADISALERQLANARKELEKETLQRVDLENRVQSLKEDLAFKTQVHQQELAETKKKTVIEREEIDAGVREEYEARLQEQLQDLREIQEEQLREVKLEYESMYERRFGDMQSALDRSMTSSDSSREDLRVTKKKISELTSEVDKLRSQVTAYESRIRDLEDQLAREQDENAERLAAKDLELGELRQLLNDQMQEYSDLLDVKIKLDNEIMAYRKLLEVEEERLNLSQTSMSSSSPGSTPVGRSKKRKRVALSEEVEEFSSESASSGFATSSSASGNVQISETDPEGKFVKIENKSGDDIAVGGWQLKHTAGDQETTYKFHRNLLLRAGETCTVWSSGVGQTHNPPNDLVMKGSRWFTDDEMKTILINSDGNEVASRDMKKTIQRTSSSFRSSGYDDLESRRRSKEERCSIM
ncbi:hypothetical protein KUTeg_017749 [Tegillarca granosa]|uniref:Lamin n=1 Tax=Tegillarca granosa TaxID=220873 RepID=A0ABQ9EJV4_TEGGR|nr:hypothetical protein KUTeg_017749 [Tegillarca granosa]